MPSPRSSAPKLLAVICAVIALLGVGSSPSAYAQMFGSHRARKTAVTGIDASVSPALITRAGKPTVTVAVVVHLMPGFHINAAKTGSPQWIPTTLAITPTTGFTVVKTTYPASEKIKEPYFDKPLLVYTGTPTIYVKVTVGPKASKGKHTLSGTLSYQGCNNQICLPYGTKPFSAVVAVK